MAGVDVITRGISRLAVWIFVLGVWIPRLISNHMNFGTRTPKPVIPISVFALPAITTFTPHRGINESPVIDMVS